MNLLRRIFRRGFAFPAHLRRAKPVDSSGLVAGDTSWMPDPCDCDGEGHRSWCRRRVVKPTPSSFAETIGRAMADTPHHSGPPRSELAAWQELVERNNQRLAAAGLRYGRMGMAVERLEMSVTVEDIAKGKCRQAEN